jgi:hypothetical protein
MSDLLKIRSKLIALIQFFFISYPSKPNETTNLTDRNVERTQDLKFLRRLNFRFWSYGLWHLVVLRVFTEFSEEYSSLWSE